MEFISFKDIYHINSLSFKDFIFNFLLSIIMRKIYH
jgi:hypothetical protein